MKIRECLTCKASLDGLHFNTKRCPPCSLEVRKRPIGKLNKQQERLVRKFARTMKIKDLAAKVGTSDANLDRWARQNNVNINWLTYTEDEVKKVCAYYEKHGRPKTEKRFPDLNCRAIVERYKLFKPRCIKWTDEQIIEAAKMAGLVSYRSQAKFFNRPRANSGSIKSLWVKRFGYRGSSLNGMPHWRAKNFVTVKARYIKPLGESRNGKPVEFKRLILWVDLERCLKPDTPDFIFDAVKTMADFQRWLWKSNNPKPLIMKMIKERELYK